MRKNIMLGILSLVVLGGAVFASGVFAASNNGGQVGRNYSSARHAQLIANGGQGRGMMNEKRGENRGGNFIDQNGDGICDHLQD